MSGVSILFKKIRKVGIKMGQAVETGVTVIAPLVVNNPNYDFGSLVTSDKFTNREIYDYIQRLHTFMLQDEAFC